MYPEVLTLRDSGFFELKTVSELKTGDVFFQRDENLHMSFLYFVCSVPFFPTGVFFIGCASISVKSSEIPKKIMLGRGGYHIYHKDAHRAVYVLRNVHFDFRKIELNILRSLVGEISSFRGWS